MFSSMPLRTSVASILPEWMNKERTWRIFSKQGHKRAHKFAFEFKLIRFRDLLQSRHIFFTVGRSPKNPLISVPQRNIILL